jgi:hypothetical protein
MKVAALMATCGRHYFCERAVGMFLAQTYKNSHLIILQNSIISQKLDRDYSNITLINKSGYNSLGAIYNDMINYIPDDIDAVCFFDDDDIYHFSHIEQGVSGLLRGGKKAYKPRYSYFLHGKSVSVISNTLEPSWFIDVSVIREQKFFDESDKHHYSWVRFCEKNAELFNDEHGAKTLAYTWGNTEQAVYKTSGNCKNPNNFENYRNFSVDHGDNIITPHSTEQLNELFKQFPEWNR